jgi:hypothetical protein
MLDMVLDVPNARTIELDDQKHALANDLHLQAAIVLDGLRRARAV